MELMNPPSLLHSSGSFREVKHSGAESSLHESFVDMRLAVPESERSDCQIDEEAFFKMYKNFIDEKRETIDWTLINHPSESQIRSYESIPVAPEKDIVGALSQLVVIKLNGGLGTSMGCFGPKSLIAVTEDKTFLDLTLRQIEKLNSQYNLDVPLVLMNSFNTQQDTESYLQRITRRNAKIFTFEQNRFPRIYEDTGLPLAKSMKISQTHDPAWYPPGHGDIYRCLHESGLLNKFIKEGKSWAFVSNIDNLGATADARILCWLEKQWRLNSSQMTDFLMEVTEKTTADIKGGTLVQYKNRLRLLEVAQVPDDHTEEFLSVRKFSIFNTNNLWINLHALEARLNTRTLEMDIIVNRKTLKDGIRVIQLEEAAGGAIKCFDKPMGLKVPRSRFLPVKQTSDLILIKSDLFTINGGQLSISPARNFPALPLVKLGKRFESIKDFQKRIPQIPSMTELYHLTVSGDVIFGRDVVLKGTVIIIAQDNEHIDIPNGSVLENKVVTGNLRIVSH